MKKKQFLMFILMLSVNFTNGQDGIKYSRIHGAIIGSGLSTFNSQKNTKSFQPKPVFFIGYYVGRDYSKMDYTLTFEFENKGAQKIDGNWKYNLYYLTVEPSLKLKFQQLNGRVMFGCYGSLLLYKNVTADNNDLANFTIGGFKKADFGFLVGFQIKLFQFSQNFALLNMQTNYGVVSIYENARFYLSDWESQWDRNFTIKIGLAIMIK